MKVKNSIKLFAVKAIANSKLFALLLTSLLIINDVYSQIPQGPPGYTFCAKEEETFTLPSKSHVAYGVFPDFHIRYNLTGTITFINENFSDITPNLRKSGFYKIVPENETSDLFLQALKNILSGIYSGGINLSDSRAISDQIYLMGSNEAVIQKALECVNAYETKYGALFINDATKGGLNNDFSFTNGSLEHTIFLIQQAILDYAVTKENIEKYTDMLDGKAFLTANFMPGFCPLPTDPSKVYTAKINASLPTFWGKRTAWANHPATRPTGYYLAPGSIGEVTVPAELVNKGFKILVGAHTLDKKTNGIRRLSRITKTFDITSENTTIYNPMGGGIYIIAPYESSEGIVEVQLSNVVPAPYFTAKSFDKTTLSDWINTQRNNPAPWADFETDNFMMQVPTKWISNLPDPVTLMENWDMIMDGVSQFLGYPLERTNTVLYLQPDLYLKGPAFGIGYPQINVFYNPNIVETGYKKDHSYLNPENFWNTELHELGHAQLFSILDHGEAEVNILAAVVNNRKFGMNLDLAFAKSIGDNPNISRDQAAMNWMTTNNFKDGKPMDNSGSELNQIRYQHRGFAFYPEIAALFGWDVFDNYFYQVNLDIMNNVTTGLSLVDDAIFRLSKASGVDMRPLIHFWGAHPNNNTELEKLLKENNLQPSALIYDRLMHYKSIIPMNKTEFMDHALIFNNVKVLTAGHSPNYGEGWYYLNQDWTDLRANAAREALQYTIDLYFPSKRPNNETDAPTPKRAKFEIFPTAESTTSITMTATTGADVNGPVLYLFTETTNNPGATSSQWQTSPTYVDSGLTPNTTYSYNVIMRDAYANRGATSNSESATTLNIINSIFDSNNIGNAATYIFPNPATDEINLLGNEWIGGTYSIVDGIGKEFLNGNLKTSSIDITTLASGLYTIKLYNNGLFFNKKFVKIK